MPQVSAEQILNSFSNPSNIRNVCIVAHVDHGKTTLTDSLLASNGVISQKLAGQLRWMDMRADEQEREITMVSRTFPLLYDSYNDRSSHPERFLVNLIDSPGHVDFQAQVKAASRLSNECLLLIDVVEGICSQTRSVLQQSLLANLKVCLVLNKIDRLIIELKMKPSDIFIHLLKLIDNLNSLVRRILNCKTEQYFCPVKGNVIFCSAIDGWGFRIIDLVRFYLNHEKMGQKIQCAFDSLIEKKSKANNASNCSDDIKEKISKKEKLNYFCRLFWNGSYSFDGKTDRFIPSHGLKPCVFVQFFLDPMFKLYESCVEQYSVENITKLISTLNLSIQLGVNSSAGSSGRPLLKIPATNNPFQKQSKTLLKTIASHWFPLSFAIFESLIESPSICHEKYLSDELQNISISESGDNSIVLVAKLMPILKGNCLEQIVGICKVIEDSFIVGDSLILSSDGNQFLMDSVFLIMGNDLIPIPKGTVITKGCIFGIGGSEMKRIIKKAFLCKNSSTLKEPPHFLLSFLNSTNSTASSLSLLRVAVEPENINDLERLQNGLDLLNQVEEEVEVTLQDNGQFIIGCSGELHLEQVMKDLIEIYAGVPVKSVPQLPPFREGVGKGKGKYSSNLIDEFDSIYFNIEKEMLVFDYEGIVHLTMKVSALCNSSISFLFNNSKAIAELFVDQQILHKSKLEMVQHSFVSEDFSIATVIEELPENIISFGPYQEPTNILAIAGHSNLANNENFNSFIHNLKYAFQLAVSSGPICNEPMTGVVFELNVLSLVEEKTNFVKIVTVMRNMFTRTFLIHSSRLFLASYLCEIQVAPEILGKVCGIISKRHGKIIKDAFDEEMNLFFVECEFPLVESSGFTSELRTKTSGLAFPQLQFGGFIPMELELFEEEEKGIDDNEQEDELRNRALKYIYDVRKSKGLFIEKEIQSEAQKQSTLKR